MASSYPLHHAAKARLPEQELRQLIEENPGAAQQVDDEGRLPLHHAASALLPPLGHGAVRALLDANPDALLAPEDNPDKNLPLHLAATNRPPLDLVELLLEGSGREAASTKNSEGQLPLHTAAYNNAPLEVIRALIDANPEALLQGDRYLDLPLHLHCAAGGRISSEAVALLLEGRGREAAAAKDLYSCLPLHFAAEWRAPLEAIRALIEANPEALLQGDGLNHRPLHLHCASNKGPASAEAAALLLEGTGREAAARKDQRGRLPLHWAADNRAPLETLRVLIEANPEALLVGDLTKDNMGFNRLPLHIYCAASGGQDPSLEAVALLLEGRGRGAAAGKDKEGNLPLHIAAQKDLPPEIIRALIEANPAALLDEGHQSKLPLHCAAEGRASPEVVALLLDGTAAEAKDCEGRLPLHLAAEQHAPLESLRALIEANPAALLAQDDNSNLPLHCAVWSQGSAEAVALLLEGSGREAASRKDYTGRLPLHLAAKNKTPLEAVRALIEANPEALLEEDLHMILPLHWAASGQPSLEIVALLLEGKGREAAARKSLYDRLPLHWAVENQAAPEVVRALIEANPEALLQGALSGSLPLHLHLAAVRDAPPEVVTLLLEGRGREAAFKKDVFDRFPLHLAVEWGAPPGAVRALLEINPAALLATDRRGCLPLHLHCAALGEASAEVLAVLLEGTGRGAAAAKDGRGRLPLHLAARDNSVVNNKAPVEAFRALIEANPAALLEEDAAKDLPIHIYLKAVWSQASVEVLALLLEGSGQETAARRGRSGSLPLHLVADRGVPVEAVKALLEAHPGALVVEDEKGNLPGDLAKRARPRDEEVVALLSPPAAAER